MKKITLIAAAVAFSASAFAQTIVSTSPKNKTAVLEEFTGIHCGYCPDGHRIANGLKQQYGDRLALINIHSGNFATPQAGELDLRTSAGDQIDNASGVTGYPAGSVNRSKSPWAESRGTWASTVSNVLSQSSPVNVGVKATVDKTTRELTVDVEAYYTADGNGTDKITVVLLQNGILGTQSDYGNYNPTNWYAGKYAHNHVFRMVLSESGAFGETISNTSKTSLFSKQYKTTLPASIKNVDLNLYMLEVVAFVADGDNQILSGAVADVEFDQTGLTDLSLVNKTVNPTGLCVDNINPKIEVTNNGTEEVTEFTVTATVGGVSTPKTFKGSLKGGEKTTIDFGDVAANAQGAFSYEINGFTNISNNLQDYNHLNNLATANAIGFSKKAFTKVRARFEPGIVDKHVAIITSSQRAFGATYSSTSNAGAYSRGAVRYYLHNSWQVAGIPGDIILGEADLTNVTDPVVKYAYAYSDGSMGGTAPTVRVAISEDCGVNWTTVSDLECTETGQPTSTNRLYVPNGNIDYEAVTVNIKDYAGKTVMVKVSGVPGNNGNALWIDGIEVNSMAVSSGIETVESTFSIYPNPAADYVQVDLKEAGDATVSIADISGKIMKSLSIDATNRIDVSELANGVYTISVIQNGQTATDKLIISK